MCELKSIWYDVFNDTRSFHMTDTYNNREFLIYKGYKIEKTENEIHFLKPVGDHYVELDTEEFQVICENGFFTGTIMLILKECESKLDAIAFRIKHETNAGNNMKQINKLKSGRESVMNQYHQLLKQINNN